MGAHALTHSVWNVFEGDKSKYYSKAKFVISKSYRLNYSLWRHHTVYVLPYQTVRHVDVHFPRSSVFLRSADVNGCDVISHFDGLCVCKVWREGKV
jgi:hypothetical protein